MQTFLSDLMIGLYFVTAVFMMLYGLNCYVMVFLFFKGRKAAKQPSEGGFVYKCPIGTSKDMPHVTTQLPVFNEYNVVERIVSAACRMHYPDGRHEIQVLDDSTDETRQLIDDVVSTWVSKGVDIKVVRRKTRKGFKAGALKEGLKHAKGELIAIFDADFVPPRDFLLQSVPAFRSGHKIGFVQARWGHLNDKHSLLTRAQAIGIDGHFMIEQAARNWNGLYMNFNGTAGIWCKKAIYEAGGWQWDTLTEDLDLSYRVQFAGWETVYLPDLVVPAEIPEDISAFKSQQFRWAKGSIQTAIKLLPFIFSSSDPLFKKIEAFFHLTHYLVHPMMTILAIFSLPVLIWLHMDAGAFLFTITAVFLVLSMAAPSSLYVVSQKVSYADWFRRILYLPVLVFVGVGIAISNSRAVIEAIVGKKSDFIRTPKKGVREIKKYEVQLNVSAIIEICLGLYCLYTFSYYLSAGKYLVGPFLVVYSLGFFSIGILTILHSIRFVK